MKTPRTQPIRKNHIKKLRRARRWSQYDLERASGISQSRLSLLERSFRPLTQDDVEVLADVFGVQLAELFDDPTNNANHAALSGDQGDLS